MMGQSRAVIACVTLSLSLCEYFVFPSVVALLQYFCCLPSKIAILVVEYYDLLTLESIHSMFLLLLVVASDACIMTPHTHT